VLLASFLSDHPHQVCIALSLLEAQLLQFIFTFVAEAN